MNRREFFRSVAASAAAISLPAVGFWQGAKPGFGYETTTRVYAHWDEPAKSLVVYADGKEIHRLTLKDMVLEYCKSRNPGRDYTQF